MERMRKPTQVLGALTAAVALLLAAVPSVAAGLHGPRGWARPPAATFAGAALMRAQFRRQGGGPRPPNAGPPPRPDLRGAERRPPGTRLTPEERERLRREIREQGRDVYGKRPPNPPQR